MRSKLAIGGSILIVLLMMFSAIPVSYGSYTEDKEYVEILLDTEPVEYDNWGWDADNYTLTFKKDTTLTGISIEIGSERDLSVHVEYTVTVYGDVTMDANNVTIDGGGKLIVYNNSFNSETNSLTIENISFALRSSMTDSNPKKFEMKGVIGDLTIKNCSLFEITSSSTRVQKNGHKLLDIPGKLLVSDTILKLSINVPLKEREEYTDSSPGWNIATR